MSEREVIYGPWKRGSWCMSRRILAPPVGEALPLVEVDRRLPTASEPDWRRDNSPTVQELAAELVRVAGERDRALEALANLRGMSINELLEEIRNE